MTNNYAPPPIEIETTPSDVRTQINSPRKRSKVVTAIEAATIPTIVQALGNLRELLPYDQYPLEQLVYAGGGILVVATCASEIVNKIQRSPTIQEAYTHAIGAVIGAGGMTGLIAYLTQ